MGTSLGDRMKENYESVTDIKLTRRMPVIIRVDGRCFHSLPLKKPFDVRFQESLQFAAYGLAGQMQGFKLAYIQSDEASFLLTDYDTLQTEAWFGNELRKMCSVSAAVMTRLFCHRGILTGVFDARAFNVPREEVTNYFLWRARDWQRNSLHMLARFHFSHEQLHGKNSGEIHEMLHGVGINWATELSAVWRNGAWLFREGPRYDILPKFEAINSVVEPLIRLTD